MLLLENFIELLVAPLVMPIVDLLSGDKGHCIPEINARQPREVRGALILVDGDSAQDGITSNDCGKCTVNKLLEWIGGRGL